MSLVKQPGGMGGFGSVGLERGEAEQSDVEGGLPQHENSAAAGATAKATAATTFAPAGSRPPVSAGATASPPVSPSNTQQGGVGPEDLEGMGLEMDESGRRISQRRRRPNMRIHDELEPSEREKAWGKGRGRRSKTTATPPIPPPSNGFRPRELLAATTLHACMRSLHKCRTVCLFEEVAQVVSVLDGIVGCGVGIRRAG